MSKETSYQVGAHSIDKETTLNGGKSIEFDFENSAIFKRLADDIYDSPEAGIREPLQNSLTAIKKAIQKTGMDESDGVVTIEVYDGEQVGLSIRDNGIGITRSILQDVLTVIGRSQNRDDGKVSGKYGMGFLACYKLVGTDGGFIMHSNSRQNSEPPIKGLWKPGLFEIDEDGEIPDLFNKNEYGTKLEFTLKSSIDIEDVRGWVEKHAEWAQFPIMYKEYDKDQSLSEDEEFGAKYLSNKHQGVGFKTQINTEHYECICSPNQDSLTLLLNSPLNRNCEYGGKTSNIINPKNFDIKLKNENGIIIKGPNKGLMPVSNAEYNDMRDGRKEKYIPESDINHPETEDKVLDDKYDICLPQPTGTRDTLEKDKYFWSYIHKKVLKNIKSKLTKFLSEIQNASDFLELQYHDKIYIIEALNNLNVSVENTTELKSDIDRELNIDLSYSEARLYTSLYENVFKVKRYSDANEASKKKTDAAVEKTAGEIISDSSISGDVFMGATLNQSKMDAVWESDENNIVLRVDSDQYDVYQEKYGWKKLRYVDKHINVEELNDDLRQYFEGNSKQSTSRSVKGIPLERRKLNIHSYETKTEKLTVNEVYERYSVETDKTLVLFPSNSEENISDYSEMTSKNVHTANSLVKIWDYLGELDNITRVEEWFDKVYNMEFTSSDGILSGEEIINDKENILFHVISDENISHFKDEEVLYELTKISNHSTFDDRNLKPSIAKTEHEKITYIPITEENLNYLASFIDKESSRHKNITTINATTDSYIGNELGYNLSKSEAYWYLWAKKPSLRQTSYIETLDKSEYTLSEEWISIINKIIEDDSVINVHKPDAKEKIYRTSEGKLSVYEMESEFDLIVTHIMSQEISMIIKNNREVMESMKSYLYDNVYPANYYGRSDKLISERSDIENIVYIPLTNNEKNDIENRLDVDDIIHMVSEQSSSFRPDSYIDSNTVAYAFARLSEDSYQLINQGNASKVKGLSEGGLELIESIERINSDS